MKQGFGSKVDAYGKRVLIHLGGNMLLLKVTDAFHMCRLFLLYIDAENKAKGDGIVFASIAFVTANAACSEKSPKTPVNRREKATWRI